MEDVHEFYHHQDPTSDANCATDHFIVEDLLDFSNEDDASVLLSESAAAPPPPPGCSPADSSTVTVVDSCNSSSFSASADPASFSDVHFSNDLCVPYDDLAELEWLSNIVEESFSSEDLQKMQLISGIKARPDESSGVTTAAAAVGGGNNSNNPIFTADVSVPAKARSKRSRVAACNWASRLLVLSPSSSSSSVDLPEIAVAPPSPPPPHHNHPSLPATASHHHHQQYPPVMGKKTVKLTVPKKRDGGNNGGGGGGGAEGRKCLHCATDKTPQWRTGPMGPKTLCNACGVRYKSGRLVPEYRPAASPTFVLTKHSNSHRKVMELRKQKEMLRGGHHPHTAAATVVQQHQQQFFHGHPHHHHHHHHHPSMVFDVSSNGDDYLIHQHVGPDFRQLI
ncbi:GATA transcription factor 12 [Linum perenne]